MSDFTARLRRWRDAVQPALDAMLGSYANVVFARSRLAGVLLLAASMEHPLRALGGLSAATAANAFARLMRYKAERWHSGYYGYNALLLGLFLVHDGPIDAFLALGLVGGGIASAMLSAVLGDWLEKLGLPLLPLPFVLLAGLLGHSTLNLAMAPPWLTTESDLPALPQDLSWLKSLLGGLGAIAFAPSLSGGILVSLAAGVYSRINALGLVSGALLGELLLGLLAGAEPSLALPVRYNAALTFAAVASVFRVPSLASLGIACFASLFSAWVAAALLLPFAPVSGPVLAWPFVLTTLLVLRALASGAPRDTLTAPPLPHASPEANLEYRANLAVRLGLPGPARFWLPVDGYWNVTQGEHGAVTHRPPWQHALDFEVLDVHGFPFRGDGTALEEYYSFGQPVLAPGTGTVVFAQDDLPDNAPGSQDLHLPYGNVIIIRHGEALYSVLAHLRQGSCCVKAGDVVVVGQVIGCVGASGRSPRPHLHFQVQPTPWLGAPTIPFSIANYAVRAQSASLKEEVFWRVGVPRQGETVRQLRPELRPEPPRFPGQRIELALELSSASAELRGQALPETTTHATHEVSWAGEHSLLTRDGKEQLYFVQNELGLVFTAYRGSTRGVLAALLQCVPALPPATAAHTRYVEHVPAVSLLPAWLRWPLGILRVFGEPLLLRVQVECVRTTHQVSISSEIAWCLVGIPCARRTGKVELDARGIVSVQLWNSSQTPLFVARRPAPAARLATADESGSYRCDVLQ